MNERDVKFFRPLWIRLLITGLVAVWFCVETLYTHEQIWMFATGAALAWAVWNLFLRFPKDVPAAATSEEPPKQP
ncbi:MAG TPA: hypothetical protein VHZ56_02935 [Devosia sp.]|jgi:hypothetical protein|nr:hypothetical protein [Devosia sp.]